MKYLKLFNESNDTFETELQEFCDNNLAYLIDMGFKVIVNRYYDDILKERSYEIKLYKTRDGSYIYYKWEEINDDFIPFLTILNNKYDIIRIKMDHLIIDKASSIGAYKSFITVNLNTMLNDKIKEDKKIDFIFIKIKKPS